MYIYTRAHRVQYVRACVCRFIIACMRITYYRKGIFRQRPTDRTQQHGTHIYMRLILYLDPIINYNI